MIEQRPTSQDVRAIIEASTLEESLDRAERIAGVRTLFRRGMDRITQPAGFNDYLHLQAHFPEQPFFNVLLLLEQMPEATKIASGLHWDAVGRPPQLVEKGIWLFVPYERKIGVDGTGEPIRELIGVGVETVYDITQTRGPIYQEEHAKPVSAADVQEQIVWRLRGALPSGQLGLGLNFETPPNEETRPESERLPTLMEALRERLIQRGRLATTELDPVAQAVATILMIQHGVELGEVWIPKLVELIQGDALIDLTLTELQQLVHSVDNRR